MRAHSNGHGVLFQQKKAQWIHPRAKLDMPNWHIKLPSCVSQTKVALLAKVEAYLTLFLFSRWSGKLLDCRPHMSEFLAVLAGMFE